MTDTVDVAVRLAPLIAAAGIWWFGFAMIRGNKARAVQAAEDRKARAAQADEDRKVTQGTLAALERQGEALAEILRRTSPPQTGPAE